MIGFVGFASRRPADLVRPGRGLTAARHLLGVADIDLVEVAVAVVSAAAAAPLPK
jgi:hypothetical protein